MRRRPEPDAHRAGAPAGTGSPERPARPVGRAWLVRIMAFLLVVATPGCAEEEPVTNPEPITPSSPFRYPVELWDAGSTGEAVVMVHVTEVGGVDSVYILERSGEPAFDSAAAAGARQLEFSPGRRGDQPVAMWVRLPVRFHPPADSGGT